MKKLLFKVVEPDTPRELTEGCSFWDDCTFTWPNEYDVGPSGAVWRYNEATGLLEWRFAHHNEYGWTMLADYYQDAYRKYIASEVLG
jgi:hypothetical protein